MKVRRERSGDEAVIGALTTAAFEHAPYASGTEAALIDAMRAAGELALSLVAEMESEIVGHVSFCTVTLNGAGAGWFGLAPLSVAPAQQRVGVGSALVRFGLEELKIRGARGCVLVGNPEYYARFGFQPYPGLSYPGVDNAYVLGLAFTGEAPCGVVRYAPAFEAAAAGEEGVREGGE